MATLAPAITDFSTPSAEQMPLVAAKSISSWAERMAIHDVVVEAADVGLDDVGGHVVVDGDDRRRLEEQLLGIVEDRGALGNR